MFTISILMSQLFLQYFTQSDDVKEVYCQVSISTTYLINGQYVSFTGGEILYFCYITKTMRTYLSNFSEEEYSVNKWINYCMPEACFSIISCWMVDKWMILLSDTVSQCFFLILLLILLVVTESHDHTSSSHFLCYQSEVVRIFSGLDGSHRFANLSWELCALFPLWNILV